MDIPSLLHRHWERLRPNCDRIMLHIDPPSPDLTASRERSMKRKFPPELHNFLANVSGELIFKYWLTKAFVRESAPGMECYPWGELELGGYQPALCKSMWNVMLTNWEGWQDCFENPDGHSIGSKIAEQKLKYEELFPIMETFSGNLLVITDDGRERSKVIYLDHEGSENDGMVLAHSFLEFMQTWCELACPSIDDLWRFHCPTRKRIVTDTPTAILWRRLLKID